MKESPKKNKIVTGLIVSATLVLAAVAVFTALRLYNLRKESVSLKAPESEPLAWDCSSYTFKVEQTGTVTVENKSSRNETPQQAKVYINNNLVATLSVPSLASGASATIGTVSIPDGSFSWRVVGTVDCQNSGSYTVTPTTIPTGTPTTIPTETPTTIPTGTPTTIPTEPPTEPNITPCQILEFNLANETATLTPTITSTVTPTSSPSVTPTTPAGQTPTPTRSIPEAPVCTDAVPPAPSITSAVSIGGNSVKVTWIKVTPATSYTILYGTKKSTYPYSVFDTGNTDNYTINGISNGCFVIKAVNGCMPGPQSPEVCSGGGVSAGSGALPSAGVSTYTVSFVAISFIAIIFAFLLAL